MRGGGRRAVRTKKREICINTNSGRSVTLINTASRLHDLSVDVFVGSEKRREGKQEMQQTQ